MELIKRLYVHLRPYRGRLFVSFLGVVLFTLLSVIPPLIVRHLVDEVIQQEAWEQLPWVALALLAVPAVAVSVRFVNVNMLIRTSRRFIAGMRLKCYNHILRHSARFHGEHSSGALVSRLMDDVNMLQRLITGNTMTVLVDVIVVIFALGASLHLALRCGEPRVLVLWLLMLGMLVSYVIVYVYYSKRIRDNTRKYRNIYDRIAGRLSETVEGVRQVRIYNREEWETEMFLDRSERSLARAFSSGLSSVSLTTGCQAISGFGSAMIVGLAAYFVLTTPFSYGDLIALNAFVWMAIAPAVRLATLAGELEETFVSVERVLDLAEEEIDLVSKPGAPKLPRGPGRVEFDHVVFGYKAHEPLYQGLNLTVEPGQTVALVGPTGCGKTSLTALLMRYWDIWDGQIRIDGHDVREVDLYSLREFFGVVLQKPVVFDGTVAENIGYGAPEATREQIVEAARAAELHESISAMRHGFDTVIGTEGVQLSLGEKQRLSIARAILKDPSILIMDEATSALDSNSEALIQKALDRVLKGRTSIIVAHRLSTIINADQIVVLDRGSIVEQGRHEELMAIDNGFYRRLYEELRGQHGEDADAVHA